MSRLYPFQLKTSLSSKNLRIPLPSTTSRKRTRKSTNLPKVLPWLWKNLLPRPKTQIAKSPKNTRRARHPMAQASLRLLRIRCSSNPKSLPPKANRPRRNTSPVRKPSQLMHPSADQPRHPSPCRLRGRVKSRRILKSRYRNPSPAKRENATSPTTGALGLIPMKQKPPTWDMSQRRRKSMGKVAKSQTQGLQKAIRKRRTRRRSTKLTKLLDLLHLLRVRRPSACSTMARPHMSRRRLHDPVTRVMNTLTRARRKRSKRRKSRTRLKSLGLVRRSLPRQIETWPQRVQETNGPSRLKTTPGLPRRKPKRRGESQSCPSLSKRNPRSQVTPWTSNRHQRS
ncbi:hypothetical protein BC567DRAFT_214850 [Phyllosticta citribraziliensis]